MTLAVVGIVLLIFGALILFTASNIFVGILGGAAAAVGGAFTAGWLVVEALR